MVHQLASVPAKLPKALHPRAKQVLHAMMNTESRATREREIAGFLNESGPKYPKAIASLTTDQARLTHFHCLAEHWKHFRSKNPIEPIFATVRLREDVIKEKPPPLTGARSTPLSWSRWSGRGSGSWTGSA